MTYIKNEREYHYPPNNYQQVVHDFLQTKEFEGIIKKKMGFWSGRKYSKEIVAITRKYEGIARALLEFLGYRLFEKKDYIPIYQSNNFLGMFAYEVGGDMVPNGRYNWLDNMMFFSGNYGDRISLMWENTKPPVLKRGDLYEKKELQQLSTRELSVLNELFSSMDTEIKVHCVDETVLPMSSREIERINYIASVVMLAVGRDSLFRRLMSEGIDA